MTNRDRERKKRKRKGGREPRLPRIKNRSLYAFSLYTSRDGRRCADEKRIACFGAVGGTARVRYANILPSPGNSAAGHRLVTIDKQKRFKEGIPNKF